MSLLTAAPCQMQTYISDQSFTASLKRWIVIKYQVAPERCYYVQACRQEMKWGVVLCKQKWTFPQRSTLSVFFNLTFYLFLGVRTRRVCSVPRKNSTFGDRSFAAAGPRAWNELPFNLRDTALSLTVFNAHLKTHLFSISCGATVHL